MCVTKKRVCYVQHVSPSSNVFLLLKRKCCVKVWRIVCVEYAMKFCNIVDNVITCTPVQSVEWETVMKGSKVCTYIKL